MQISSLNSIILISNNLEENIQKIQEKFPDRRIFILTDENTFEHCLPFVLNIEGLHEASVITIASGELNKTIESVIKVWSYLSSRGADRNSILINLGGGMISDLGGFAASAFKRGILFINIPTTLLAQVDASVGGKTGINFQGLKNEIGAFKIPEYVIVYSGFLKTLDRRNLLSGYAEMLKHGLIYSEEHYNKLTQFEIIDEWDMEKLTNLIWKSIFIKNDFVQNDPLEKNKRKVLNFGHTFGHAFESYSYSTNKPLYHGEAVAHGMICELYLSALKLKFPEPLLKDIKAYMETNYGVFELPESAFETVFELMTHDKKNEQDKINFTLLKNIGIPEINVNCTKAEIFDVFKRIQKVETVTNSADAI